MAPLFPLLYLFAKMILQIANPYSVGEVMDRRSFAVSAVGGAIGALGSTPAMAETKGVQIQIAAPEDAFVQSAGLASGSVQLGTPLYVLKSLRLLERKNHLSILRKKIEIAERPFLDGRVSEEIEMIKAKSQDLKTAYDDAVKIKDNTQVESDILGNIDKDKLYGVIDYALKAHVSLLEAELSVRQTQRKSQDALDKIQLAKSKLEFHEMILAQLESALTINSPAEGNFKSFVAPGLYIKRGHILGIIER